MANKNFVYDMMNHEVARKHLELAIREYGFAHRLKEEALKDFYKSNIASPFHYPLLFDVTRGGKPTSTFAFHDAPVSKVAFLSIQQSYLAQLEYELKNPQADTSLCHYAQEYCTVKFQLPRRSGKTTALIDVGKICFKNVIFITHSLNEVNRISNLWNKAKGDCQAKFFSYHQVMHKDLAPIKDIDAILVDNAFGWTDNETILDECYMCFCGGSNRPFFIVMMD